MHFPHLEELEIHMDSNKLILYIRTIRHLRLKQLYYQLYYRARKIFKRKKEIEISIAPVTLLRWNDYYFHPNSYQENNTFEFLNLTHCFSNTINWNYSGHGKLWTYNLNYFEFLNQKELDAERGISLIKNYIKDNNTLLDGLEPYPISLRGINWIKFLDRKSTRLNSSHVKISYAVFCLKKKKEKINIYPVTGC